LGDLLGDEHDLAVLHDTLMNEPQGPWSSRELQVLLGLANERRTVLRRQARPLGGRLFAEIPEALIDRFGGYWHAWRGSDL
jgi:hypothetical protein